MSRSSLPIKAGPEIFAHREKGDRIPINRFVVIILDSIGVGELPDAAAYGDVGSHTLGNMARTVGGLKVPHLEAMSLGNIVIAERGGAQTQPTAAYGKLAEASLRKDTTTGHWELMGIQLHQPYPLYPDGFPPEVMDRFEAEIGRGTLANYPASGTVIIDELGEEHIRSRPAGRKLGRARNLCRPGSHCRRRAGRQATPV